MNLREFFPHPPAVGLDLTPYELGAADIYIEERSATAWNQLVSLTGGGERAVMAISAVREAQARRWAETEALLGRVFPPAVAAMSMEDADAYLRRAALSVHPANGDTL